MIALWTNKKMFSQLGNRTDIIAIRTLSPESFGSFFFFGSAGQNAFPDPFEPTAFTFLTKPIIACKVRFKIIISFHATGFEGLR
jgi:hypothetical protein